MNIIIKNVTSEPMNNGLILELSRAGFSEGTKVYHVRFSEAGNSCSWETATDNCIAYLGETCEELPRKLTRKSR